jgi:septum formation protein
MNHLSLPQAEYLHEKIYLVTADTLIGIPDSQQIFKKPKDLADAKQMLAHIGAQPVSIQTGCCVSAQQWNGTNWNVLQQKTIVVGALVEFAVDAESMDNYFKYEPNALNACGASVVDSFGQCFFASMNGSYSAILGLPLFELRAILKEFDFIF